MLRRSHRNPRHAKIAPAERRVLKRVRMLANHIDDLARGLGVDRGRIGRSLGVLRAQGVGRLADIVRPELSGRTVASLTYVSLRTLEPAATDAFEAWCRQDGAVTQAVLLAGRCDYALWAWHRDERESTAWRRELECRDEVARCETRYVRVMFGHALDGAPVFTR